MIALAVLFWLVGLIQVLPFVVGLANARVLYSINIGMSRSDKEVAIAMGPCKPSKTYQQVESETSQSTQ